MPSPYIRINREEILYEYPKLISGSGYGGLERGFTIDRSRKLRDGGSRFRIIRSGTGAGVGTGQNMCALRIDQRPYWLWSKGGKSSAKNCQMLCITHNRAKGNR